MRRAAALVLAALPCGRASLGSLLFLKQQQQAGEEVKFLDLLSPRLYYAAPPPPEPETKPWVFAEERRFDLVRRVGGRLFGASPEELETWAAASNVAYCALVAASFALLPTKSALALTALTFPPLGPLLVFLTGALVVAALTAFAALPITSVLSLWLLCLLKVKAFEKIFGVPGDGGFLDLLGAVATTRLGTWLHLEALHDFLQRRRASRRPLAALSAKVSALEATVQQLTLAVRDQAAAKRQAHVALASQSTAWENSGWGDDPTA